MEAITLMIEWHHNTMKIGNNSKSGHVEKQTIQKTKVLKSR